MCRLWYTHQKRVMIRAVLWAWNQSLLWGILYRLCTLIMVRPLAIISVHSLATVQSNCMCTHSRGHNTIRNSAGILASDSILQESIEEHLDLLHCSVIFAKLSPSHPANLQLSWAVPYYQSWGEPTLTQNNSLDLLITYFCIVHNLFVTCSWLVHDLFINCSWLVHYLCMTCSLLVHDLCMTCSTLAHNCSWLFIK